MLYFLDISLGLHNLGERRNSIDEGVIERRETPYNIETRVFMKFKEYLEEKWRVGKVIN